MELKSLKYYHVLYFVPAALISIILLSPFLSIFLSFFENHSNHLIFLKENLIFDYVINSMTLVSGVVILTFFLGTIPAYLVSFFEFPGRNFFKWSLILSFAIPSYIYGYSLTAFFENFGTAYSILTNVFGDQNFNYYIPKIDGMIASVTSLSFTLFGYVYILSRTSFINLSQNLIEVSQNLGFSSLKIFFHVILPISRPAIFTGLALVTMETLADFGTVYFFNVKTLTTAIYDSWISFDDLNSSYKLSFILLIFVICTFSIEIFSRNKAKYYDKGFSQKQKRKLKKLNTKNGFLAFIFCFLLFFFSFMFPVLQMLFWCFKFPEYMDNLDLISLNFNVFKLVFFSTILIIFLSFFVCFSNRILNSKFLFSISNLSIIGYAVPGLVISVAILSFFSEYNPVSIFDRKIIILGSIFGLIIAYFFRFYFLSYNSLQSNFSKISRTVDESAYLLGYSKIKTLLFIHLPYFKSTFFLISILLSIEIIKELPITLMLKPFNFETFATKAYAFASQDLLEATASPSIFLIFWASIFILFTLKFSDIDK